MSAYRFWELDGSSVEFNTEYEQEVADQSLALALAIGPDIVAVKRFITAIIRRADFVQSAV